MALGTRYSLSCYFTSQCYLGIQSKVGGKSRRYVEVPSHHLVHYRRARPGYIEAPPFGVLDFAYVTLRVLEGELESWHQGVTLDGNFVATA